MTAYYCWQDPWAKAQYRTRRETEDSELCTICHESPAVCSCDLCDQRICGDCCTVEAELNICEICLNDE